MLHRPSPPPPQRQPMPNPPVSQKVRAKSATVSACNIRRLHSVPEALQQFESIQLLRNADATVNALRRDRRQSTAVAAVADASARAAACVNVTFSGRSTLGLSRDECDALADEIVRRAVRQHLSDSHIGGTVPPGVGTSGSVSEPTVLSGAHCSPRSDAVAIRARSSPKSIRKQERLKQVLLLCTRVTSGLERSLARARERIYVRRCARQEVEAAYRGDRGLLARSWAAWQTALRFVFLRRRRTLHKMLKFWNHAVRVQHDRRAAFYGALFRSIEVFRVRRVLRMWYVVGVAELALKRNIEPLALIQTRAYGSQLVAKRNRWVLRGIDAAMASHVKAEKMTEILTNHQSRLLRVPWSAWREYVFRRRAKHNTYHLLRVHENRTLRRRTLSRTFALWRFRMNAARSLSLYLYSMQQRFLQQWKKRLDDKASDTARLTTAKASIANIVARGCIQHWRRKTNERTLLALLGTCRILKQPAKLLPFVFDFLAIAAAGTKEAEALSTQSNAARCLAQWKKYWQRRRQFRDVSKQQHRLYCYLLLQRAFTVWRVREASWDTTTNPASTFLPTSTTAIGATGTLLADGATRTNSHEAASFPAASTASDAAPDTAATASANSAKDPWPVVTLLPVSTNLSIPWNQLRAVERHCRRSYASYGSLESDARFAPHTFFTTSAATSSTDGRVAATSQQDLVQPSDPQASAQRRRSSAVVTAPAASSVVLLQHRVSDTFFAVADQEFEELLASSLSNARAIDQQHERQRRRRRRSTSFVMSLSDDDRDDDDGEIDTPAPPALGFYHFLLHRVLQSLFVVGRIIISSRHAVQRLREYSDLIFSKHIALSKERILEIEQLLHSLQMPASHAARSVGSASGSSAAARFRRSSSSVAAASPTASPLRGIPSAFAPSKPYVPSSTARRTSYGSILPLDHVHGGMELVPLVTERERLLEEFAQTLQEHRETLYGAHRVALLKQSPDQILALFSEIGFSPPVTRATVEDYLDQLALFLNRRVLEQHELRISSRMRLTFVTKRFAVTDASQAFWAAAGVRLVLPPGCTETVSRLLVRPPRRRGSRQRDSGGARRPPGQSAKSSTSSGLSIRSRTIEVEHLILDVAIAWRIRAARRFPSLGALLSFTPTMLFCLVPPKVVVQTVARSRNAPDKLVSRSAIMAAAAASLGAKKDTPG